MFDKRQFYKQQKDRLQSAHQTQKYTLKHPGRKKKAKSRDPPLGIAGEQANLNYFSNKDNNHRLRFYL